MKKLFAPNIDTRGRLVRGVVGLVLLAVAVLVFGQSLELAVVLGAAGAFALFEAFRGWCAARACGIKTRL